MLDLFQNAPLGFGVLYVLCVANNLGLTKGMGEKHRKQGIICIRAVILTPLELR